MSNLEQLPTTFLTGVLLNDPKAEVFSWGETRVRILQELARRKALGDQQAAPPVIPEVPLPADLRRCAEQPAQPFVPADPYSQACITVVIFTSYVPSHPLTWLIDRVADSIRRHLPDSRLVFLADGCEGPEPPEYREFKDRAKARYELVEHQGRHHQTLMLKGFIGLVDTPLVLVGEHDWGIRKAYIDWRGIANALLDMAFPFDLVQIRQARLAGWEHRHTGGVVRHCETNFAPTTLFQCPVHVALTAWYQGLSRHFSQPSMLEGDQTADALKTIQGLDRMAIYIPDGPAQRLYHLNGRELRDPDQLAGIGD